MKAIIRKASFLVGLALCVSVCAKSQVVTSTKNGLWNDPTVWDSGQVPTMENATETVVNHEVLITDSTSISVQNVVVNDRLTVGVGAVVDIFPDALPEKKDLLVLGVLVMNDGATLNGTTVSNTSFESGSRYIHLQGPLGFIPYATWDTNSTFEIAGFRSQGYINIAHSDSWKQNFGHVVYNCPQQTTAFVDLNGYLRNIAGNFIVESTNNQVLRLSTTQNPVISIGGDFVVQGPSKVWLSTTPANTIVNIQQNMRYLSTSAGISYLTTKGVVTVNVTGDFEMNSPGRIQMASTSPDSTGARLSTLRLQGDLTVSAGTIIAPPSPGKGTIQFAAIGTQRVNTSASGTSFAGNLDYIIDGNAIVDLGNSVLSNTTGALQVNGTLQVGSTNPAGAIQTGNAGNIQVQGTRTYQSGATIEYNGLGPQYIGNGHPTTPEINLICSNPGGTTLLNEIITGDFTALGNVDMKTFSLTSSGNIFIAEGVNCFPHQVNLRGGIEQQISAFGASFRNLTIDKSSGSVTLTSPLSLSGKLRIESPNTSLHSNGHLLLLSTSDEIEGTASVGPLPQGSAVTGDVTVQRHMAGEGRIYRYISSPVQNGSVASLKDDFPVTGKFLDPSTGGGINSAGASFYYYDQSVGGLSEGWKPYPTSGLASANPLVVGKGYAAFIRKATGPTIWDVTGPLNQGTIELAIDFTPNNQPSNGWNLVGNPYACAIQWDEAGENKWTIENISSVIAIRDNGGASGTYKYWDMDDNYSGIPGGQIALGQSFWVRATDENPRLTIREGVKVLEGATFFRNKQTAIPSFAISLTKDSVTDVAYYKIRPTAKPGTDQWDGLKLDNEWFDISFMAESDISMAIHATNKLPCDTTIRLAIKDLTPGSYHLKLSPRLDFVRYRYTLLDKFSGTQTNLTPDHPVELVVTDDPASFVADRLAIQLIENMPANDLPVAGAHSVCEDSLALLTIKGAEAGINYTIWDGEVGLLASAQADVDGDLDIRFQASLLQPGENLLRIKAHATCHAVTLQGTHVITRESTPSIWADSVTACAGSAVTLKAFSDHEHTTFTWYNESDSPLPVGSGAAFTTGTLIKPKVYYVRATGPSGCTSRPLAVKVAINTFVPAQITVIGDTLIVSNHLFNNVWFFEGEKVEGWHERHLPLDQPGTYTLQTDSMGCISTDTFEHEISKNDPLKDNPYAYPNPASEIIFLDNGKNRIEDIKIIDELGGIVKGEMMTSADSTGCALTVGHLAAGNYFAIVTTLGQKQVIRFTKK